MRKKKKKSNRELFSLPKMSGKEIIDTLFGSIRENVTEKSAPVPLWMDVKIAPSIQRKSF
ncbi:hypothetical protein [Ornithinibacillus sp. JPR2-1]|uniref:hypothetical protein n=1 Tax=Ornithinibacillus sp. JPR2-1 TaxID=2094019 RepID=UPI0031E41AD8